MENRDNENGVIDQDANLEQGNNGEQLERQD